MKTFFKQFWNLVKQNKLFTSIYVIGSGIAIAMTMAIFIVLYMKFAPIYPEYNRNRTLVMKYIGRTGKVKDVGRWGGALSYQLAEKLRTLTHVDKVASMSKLSSKEYYSLLIPQTNTNLGVVSIFTDADYWKVFQFHFISGRPFTETEVTSNLPVVILSEHTAMRVFASTDVVDKLIVINGNEYKVCGVVKEVSTTQPTTSAEIYPPLFNFPPNKQANGWLGNVEYYITATDTDATRLLKTEITDMMDRLSQEDPEYEWHIYGQPDEYWMSIFRTDTFSAPHINEIMKGFVYILIALLFIPALNLSGMISSRMNRRIAEIGVRKAYGATNQQIIMQLLNENLLLTCVGGIIGLLFSYLFVMGANEWIHYIFDDTPNVYADMALPTITFEMFFNPFLFVTVFVLCLLLNVISALVPTAWAMRRTIIQCIYTKR